MTAGDAPGRGEALKPFAEEELHRRAALRVAMLIRGLWEEKGSSDTRLLEALLIPDRFTLVGRSVAAPERGRREHVVPRKVIADECHRMLVHGADDAQIAAFIIQHVKIVIISDEECRHLDQTLGLRQRMPDGWRLGDDVFARLEAAEIAWRPLDLANGRETT